ncbi:Holliday junction branch migration protein RuvA [Chitinimonas sp. BJB300]|uniref:Holliday junction branch migration protein RuvA n=1 Tax=Chitinimonas sp. BJB300 TaxID=1559339 RepID=UPI000C0E25A4|nr:Holliday junction branch migration protein RuvA [Chitinimonas sp. BJB300]PHV10873.1 Holliday junction branch migration protein RuvA [Chitinimonas sp. BJB300]TSJ91315.1 Holliday junction branch migration protein RuvA [Chitinimonas sp. BJB300]
MIGKLTGKLLEKHPPHILLDVHGVGYELDVPMSTLYVLPHAGEATSLYVHFVVREDAQLLYGFATRAERETFRQLVKVSGIGPKIALAVLSGMTSDELATAVEGEDAARLSKVPGIGKKTAERLVLELRGKLVGTTALQARVATTLFAAQASAKDDVANALLALGYNTKEAEAAIKLLPEDVNVNDGIRQALKSLAKG